MEAVLQEAAAAIRAAEGLLIGAGAGMGVDSGLPDFRGDEGFWRAYPPFRKLDLSFMDLADPQWFARDPSLAWGFYGHRLQLYRQTTPHVGFQRLRRWAADMALGCFVFTSNVDGQFQKAGFAAGRIQECHGSIHRLQCQSPCGAESWSADDAAVIVDPESFRADPDTLPRCPRCAAVARPNILMFGDDSWQPQRTRAQQERQAQWLRSAQGRRLAVVELGAGTAVPSVRMFCQKVARHNGHGLVRINPREPQTAIGVGLATGADEALAELDARL